MLIVERSSAEKHLLAVTAVLAFVFGTWNATLFGDDLFMLPWFRVLHETETIAAIYKKLFLATDLYPGEYRTYGLSRVLHYSIWLVAQENPYAWTGIIAGSQALSGLALHRLLQRMGCEQRMSQTLSVMWILSPFAVTSCFHYYSYLILPYQLLIALCLFRGAIRIPVAIAIGLTGETHIVTAVLAIWLVAWRDKNFREAIAPTALILLAIAAHRFAWKIEFPDPVSLQRFQYEIRENFLAKSMLFAPSVLTSVYYQAYYIFAFLTLPSVGIATIVSAAMPNRTSEASPRGAALAAILFGSSLAVIAAITILSGQGLGLMPRRYGYVPITIFFMAIYMGTPWAIARKIVLSFFLTAWCTLQLVVLPTIRSQDQLVFSVMSEAIRANPYVIPPVTGMRPQFDGDIVETALATSTYSMQYFIARLGAKVAPPGSTAVTVQATTAPGWQSAPSVGLGQTIRPY